MKLQRTLSIVLIVDENDQAQLHVCNNGFNPATLKIAFASAHQQALKQFNEAKIKEQQSIIPVTNKIHKLS